MPPTQSVQRRNNGPNASPKILPNSSRGAFANLRIGLSNCRRSASQTVNAVRLKNDRDAAKRMQHAASLVDALDLDMTEWFTPTDKLSKGQIIEALSEIKATWLRHGAV